MSDSESAANIVIALINNSRVTSPKEAAEAYKIILKAMTNSNN